MLTLYGNLESGNVYKVRLIMALTGVAHRRVEVNQVAGDPRSPAYRAMAPIGKVPAVKFDDDCFRYFSYGRGEDYLENVPRAVARAAQENPPYLETTYRDAQNWVAYNMK